MKTTKLLSLSISIPEPSVQKECKAPTLMDKIKNACAVTRAIKHPKRQMAIRFLQEVHQHLTGLPQLDEESSAMLELTKGIVEEYGIPADLIQQPKTSER